MTVVGTNFRKNVIYFLHDFRNDFKSIRRNVRADRDKISRFGTSFRKYAINFLQKFKIDLESIHRNVKSDL